MTVQATYRALIGKAVERLNVEVALHAELRRTGALPAVEEATLRVRQGLSPAGAVPSRCRDTSERLRHLHDVPNSDDPKLCYPNVNYA